MSNINGLGWLPDHPDVHDYNPEHPKICDFFRKSKLVGDAVTAPDVKCILPESDFSTIEDQGIINSCTANAGVGLLEYYQKKSKGKYIDMSRLFLYKVTRDLLNLKGDTGAQMRTTMGAMVLFGVPPEKYMPYITANYDNEPSAFLYSYARNFETIRYYRLDPLGTSKSALLNRIKLHIKNKLPSMFGFTLYTSSAQARNNKGEIPFPAASEGKVGGHAVIAMGYDDAKEITNTNDGSKTTGAIKIRNSWGTGWGNNGYGWIPYEYILKGLAIDWWSLIRSEWVDVSVFN